MVRLERIRAIAKEKRVQLKEIAEYIGITPAGMQHILNSNTTSVTTLLRIANYLKVPISVFFDQDIEIQDKSMMGKESAKEDEILSESENDSLSADIEALKYEIDSLKKRVLKLERK